MALQIWVKIAFFEPADKSVDVKILFYCLEEKLNLATVFVERSNGLCRQRKIMGEKFVELTRRASR